MVKPSACHDRAIGSNPLPCHATILGYRLVARSNNSMASRLVCSFLDWLMQSIAFRMSQAIASVDKQCPRSCSSLMTRHRRSYHLAIRVNEPQEGVWARPYQTSISLHRLPKYECQSLRTKEGTRHKIYIIHTPTHIDFTIIGVKSGTPLKPDCL